LPGALGKTRQGPAQGQGLLSLYRSAGDIQDGHAFRRARPVVRFQARHMPAFTARPHQGKRPETLCRNGPARPQRGQARQGCTLSLADRQPANHRHILTGSTRHSVRNRDLPRLPNAAIMQCPANVSVGAPRGWHLCATGTYCAGIDALARGSAAVRRRIDPTNQQSSAGQGTEPGIGRCFAVLVRDSIGQTKGA
jgi:hypothetical protein